ncbi:hypothetical protein M1328_04935 [Patescibacteria group bacterium]|nr:hypothetical protein [Patescibacteria group bacterium]
MKPDRVLKNDDLTVPSVTGMLTDDLNEKYPQNKIIVVNKVTYANLKRIKKFKAIIIVGSLNEISHENLLLKDLHIPYIQDVGAEVKDLIGQEIKLLGEQDKRFSRQNFALSSSISGLKYYWTNKFHSVATRGEFVLLHLLTDHPLQIIKTQKGYKKVFNHLLETKEFAAKNFKKAIFRFSDFSSENLYQFKSFSKIEKRELNPAVGNRGAHRLLNDHYRLFLLELEVINKLWKNYKNIEILVPYVRSVKEAKKITTEIRKRLPAEIKLGCMVEVPSLIFYSKEINELFDFFVVGTKDLIQLMSGADRNNIEVRHDIDEVIVHLLIKYFFPGVDKNKEIYITSWVLFDKLKNQVKNDLQLIHD